MPAAYRVGAVVYHPKVEQIWSSSGAGSPIRGWRST
jgi:hypothetical protein